MIKEKKNIYFSADVYAYILILIVSLTIVLFSIFFALKLVWIIIMFSKSKFTSNNSHIKCTYLVVTTCWASIKLIHNNTFAFYRVKVFSFLLTVMTITFKRRLLIPHSAYIVLIKCDNVYADHQRGSYSFLVFGNIGNDNYTFSF